MATTTSTPEAILDAVGGAENIIHFTHCATRLRFELKDASGKAALVVTVSRADDLPAHSHCPPAARRPVMRLKARVCSVSATSAGSRSIEEAP